MKHVYLLGAGFTRTIIKDAPLTADLMSRLDISKCHPDTQEYMYTIYKQANPDIEIFFTSLDIQIKQLEHNCKALYERFKEARDAIKNQVVSFCDINVLNVGNKLEDHPCLSDFINRIPDESTILTLNYDCDLDQGLYLSKRWSPDGGYIIEIQNGRNNNLELANIHLLKLHGSCNFRKTSFDKENKNSKVKHEDFTVEVNETIFPNLNQHYSTPSDAGPHVLVMSYIKPFNNQLRRLWREAICNLKNADRLTIIGCSLRDEDTFLRYALSHFGMKEGVSKYHIDIVDKEDQCETVKSKISEIVAWPNRIQYKLYKNGLSEFLS